MPKPVFQKNNLVELMKDNIKLLKELDKTIEIEFKNNVQQIFFNCDREQLSRVFLNLIKNSIESIQQKAENSTAAESTLPIQALEKDYEAA